MGEFCGYVWQEVYSKSSSCGASMVEMKGGRRRAERREKEGVGKGKGVATGKRRKKRVARND